LVFSEFSAEEALNPKSSGRTALPGRKGSARRAVCEGTPAGAQRKDSATAEAPLAYALEAPGPQAEEQQGEHDERDEHIGPIALVGEGENREGHAQDGRGDQQ